MDRSDALETTAALIADLGSDFSERFEKLLRVVDIGSPRKSAALVPVEGERSRVKCTSFAAGKDVEIVLVRAQPGDDGRALALREMLTYRDDVAGTDLVYDLTGEFMQGKARPFECDLQKLPARLYALLPFQMESLSVTIPERAKPRSFQIEFRDGLDQRVTGALPCQVELQEPDGKAAWRRRMASSKEGYLSGPIELPQGATPGKWLLVVRSQLDGKQAALPVFIAPSGRQ